LRINSTKGLRMSGLIVVVNSMTEMTN